MSAPRPPLRRRIKAALVQAGVLAGLFALAFFLFANARANLAASGVVSGFGFLWQPAGFDINQTLIAYSETSTYGRVFLVGALNTLLVTACALVLSTLIGFTVGVARLSSNPVLSRLAGAFVEISRNLPALFHLLFWYVVLLAVLPLPRDSWSLGGVAFLNVRGLFLPKVLLPNGFAPLALVLALMVLGGVLARGRGAIWRLGGAGAGLALGLVATGPVLAFDMPQLSGFNFRGGLRFSPEFVVLVFGLSVYTAGYIAEIVRGGLLSVSRGQRDAARALGLTQWAELRYVVLPQAMRVAVPALTSQYLNIAKNSSLAIAIGYPDLASVFFQTTLHITGQAIEIVALTMMFYLAISLITSLGMNIYNRRVMRGAR